MHFSIIKNLFFGPWMIQPTVAGALRPLWNGMLHGLEFEQGKAPESYRMTSTAGSGQDGNPGQIFVCRLEGVMTKYDQECGPLGTTTLAAQLLAADQDPAVVGHILSLDSGGGSAAAVPELAMAIKKLTKPIVGYVDGMACSAAMYAVSYCDYIYAHHPQDMVGCIGTMIEFADFPKKATLEDGRIVVRVYADGSEEKNADFEAALEGNFKLIRSNLLNPITQQFKADMRANRPMVEELHLKGKTFFASDVTGSLIDSIGDLSMAAAKVLELARDGGTTSTTQKSFNTHSLNTFSMEAFNNISAIDSCAQLEMQDNGVFLNEAQLREIDAALGAVATLATTQQSLSTVQQELATRNNRIAELEQELATRDSRITELENSLDDGTSGGAATPGEVNPLDGKKTEELSPFEICRQHLKNHS